MKWTFNGPDPPPARSRFHRRRLDQRLRQQLRRDAGGRSVGGSRLIPFRTADGGEARDLPRGAGSAVDATPDTSGLSTRSSAGRRQRLPNGHWLVTEATAGRVFEIDERGARSGAGKWCARGRARTRRASSRRSLRGHALRARSGDRRRERVARPAAAEPCSMTSRRSPRVLAYLGPGGALSAVGSFLALLGAILLAVIGFVWYPVKRLLRSAARERRGGGAPDPLPAAGTRPGDLGRALPRRRRVPGPRGPDASPRRAPPRPCPAQPSRGRRSARPRPLRCPEGARDAGPRGAPVPALPAVTDRALLSRSPCPSASSPSSMSLGSSTLRDVLERGSSWKFFLAATARRSSP